jgi:hypothetical protein
MPALDIRQWDLSSLNSNDTTAPVEETKVVLRELGLAEHTYLKPRGGGRWLTTGVAAAA